MAKVLITNLLRDEIFSTVKATRKFGKTKLYTYWK